MFYLIDWNHYANLNSHVYHPSHQRVLLKLWQGHELLYRQRSRPVKIQLLEPLPQPLDLLCIKSNAIQGQGSNLITHTDVQTVYLLIKLEVYWSLVSLL